jgi:hypothetical protein
MRLFAFKSIHYQPIMCELFYPDFGAILGDLKNFPVGTIYIYLTCL